MGSSILIAVLVIFIIMGTGAVVADLVSGNAITGSFSGFRRALREQARKDYLQARGTAHKQLLQKLVKEKKRVIQPLEKKLASAQQQLQQLSDQHDLERKKALAHYLVHHKLQNVPGISAKLQQAIISQVYRGNIFDLKHARLVNGIGEQKQAAIDQWLWEIQSNQAALLAGDFPQKEKIDRSFQEQAAGLRKEIHQCEAALDAHQETLQKLEAELSWLTAVTEKSFFLAALTPEHRPYKLDEYIAGVFPEWEPMPVWLQQAVAEASDHGAK